MTKLFNKRFRLRITLKQMETLIYKHGILNGIGSYKPGHIPWSKGKKIGHHTSKYSNFKPIGSECIVKNGSKEYIKVKISHCTWKSKHAVIWEKENGKVPKGHVVIFADGNNRNFDLYNLLLVSRAELGIMNHLKLISNHKDLTKAGKIVADLRLLMKERKTKNRGTRAKQRKAI
ncbi:MAG: HNH endonuclease [Treponema sp.]|nr:HNH endonuclease [Treponema sp.]